MILREEVVMVTMIIIIYVSIMFRITPLCRPNYAISFFANNAGFIGSCPYFSYSLYVLFKEVSWIDVAVYTETSHFKAFVCWAAIEIKWLLRLILSTSLKLSTRCASFTTATTTTTTAVTTEHEEAERANNLVDRRDPHLPPDRRRSVRRIRITIWTGSEK